MTVRRPGIACRIGLLLGAMYLIGAGRSTAGAQQDLPDRIRQFATLPDWTGVWETELSAQLNNGELDAQMADAIKHPERIRFEFAPKGVLSPAEVLFFSLVQLYGKPPYNAEWERWYRNQVQVLHRTPASAVQAGSVKACTWGFPTIMESPTDGVFELFVTPEQTLILFEDGEARHIFTDRPHPGKEDLWPTDLGNSVGRWEGDTLVIDTIETRHGLLADIPHFLSPNFSDQVHFTERLRRTSRTTMQDRMTIDDPAHFAHPWQLTLKYRRVTTQDRLLPANCTENDRFKVVNGRLTITPREGSSP